MKYLFLLVPLLWISCNAAPSSPRTLPVQDTSIHPDNAYSPFFLTPEDLDAFLDSNSMEDSTAFLVKAFYVDRNFHYAWFHPDGPFQHTYTFARSLEDAFYTYNDSSFYYPRLFALKEDKEKSGIFDKRNQEASPSDELKLTAAFFHYAQILFGGKTQIDQRTLGWYIPKKKVNPKTFLDSLIANQGAHWERYIPVNRQYQLLESRLADYQALRDRNLDWQPLKLKSRSLKPGEEDSLVLEIKRRLFFLGDLPELDSTTRFHAGMEQGVRRFQQRHGLQADGVIGAGTIEELNQGPEQRIRQMLVNLERLRWLPKEPEQTYLLINIPQYQLHVYDSGTYRWSMNVIVGTEAHRTVVFSRAMKSIVFSPYWNIPPGITKNEILPAIARNPRYLEENHMEKHAGGYRQKPGPWNALGKVKFLFPNEYHIYLHGTPAMGLFQRDKRALSHGCIRLEEPGRLARFLLREEPDIDSVQIEKWMNARKEKHLSLEHPVPVYIVYCTAWVDHWGNLQFRKDIYGHDARLAQHLFP